MDPGGQTADMHAQVHSWLLALQQHQYTTQAAGLKAVAPAAPAKKPKSQRHPTKVQPQVGGAHTDSSSMKL